MKQFEKYRFYIVLILIVIFAFSVRMLRFYLDNRVEKDAVLYIQMAEDWNSKGVEHAFDRNPRIPPLFIFLMMVGEKLGIGAESSGVAISILSGTLTVLAIFLISYTILDKNLALIAAFLAAMHPVFIRLNPEVMRGSLFIFCYSFSLAFFVLAIDKKRIYFWGIGGFFAALAVMTRSEGAELIIVPFIWIIFEIFMEFLKRKTLGNEGKIGFTAIISCKSVFKQYLPGLLTSIVIFSIFSFPFQIALKETSSKWTVFDYRLWSYLEGMMN